MATKELGSVHHNLTIPQLSSGKFPRRDTYNCRVNSLLHLTGRDIKPREKPCNLSTTTRLSRADTRSGTIYTVAASRRETVNRVAGGDPHLRTSVLHHSFAVGVLIMRSSIAALRASDTDTNSNC